MALILHRIWLKSKDSARYLEKYEKHKTFPQPDLDQEEQEILTSFEKGEWKTVKNVTKEKMRTQKSTTQTLSMNAQIPLPAAVLARRSHLLDKPAPTELIGHHVRLIPLVIARDAEALFEVSNGSPLTLGEKSIGPYDADELIWRYMFDGPFKNITDFTASLQTHVNATYGLGLCVFDLATGRQIGVTNFINNFSAHLKIELGGIWYSPISQRTAANTESTYLMLKYAFDLGYRRVEWKCDIKNERSRQAALRMGFTFEGIQESHFIVKGCNRDTAWFRILEAEWPTVKARLEQLLSLSIK